MGGKEKTLEGRHPPPLPESLPRPEDDGAAAHLTGKLMPDVTLRSTRGDDVNLVEFASDRCVVYVFPKMGRPGEADPEGWSEVPGAYGCTQQSCAFSDHRQSLAELGYTVAGLSVQDHEAHSEAAERLHLGFPLLADPERQVGEALDLPILEIAGLRLYKRVTLVAHQGRIVKVFYPVFPPHENPEEVLGWIRWPA